MPKSTYKIQGFHGGISSDTDPRDIKEIESPNMVDVNIDSVGRIKTLGSVDNGNIYHSGIALAQTGTPATTSVRLAATADGATDDIYNAMVIAITGGTNNGEERIIDDYDASGHANGAKTAIVSVAFTAACDATSVYEIRGDGNALSILANKGLFVMSSDKQLDGGVNDETIIFNYDVTNTSIDAKDSEGWDNSVITFGGVISPVYYSADGVLRVSDSTFSEASRWFGYIEDERFNGLNADSAAINWYNIEQSLATPTLGKCLISIPYKGSDTNGINSSSKEYIGEVIDGSAAQSSTAISAPQVVDHSSVNLRVGIQYNEILPNTASDTGATNGTDSDSVNSPYAFLQNNIHIGGSTSDDEDSRLSDTVASGSEFTIDDGVSFAIPFFISSGRQYNDMTSVWVIAGLTNNSNSYYWKINVDEITPDCWNFIVCAKDTHDSIASGTPPDWGAEFDYWEVRVRRKPTGYDSNDGMIWKMSGPIQIQASSIDAFNPGVYTFHYTWLYDAKNKQESLPYQFGDIDTYYSGEHDAADHSTVMTDSGASFIADQLIGRVIKNTTDTSEGIITDNSATTVTTAALYYGSDNSWDTSGDDDYEIPKANVNKLVILRNPCLLNFDAYICSNVAAGNEYGLNKRISGSRIYWKVEENDNYFLVGELDFIEKGFKWIPEADTNSYDMTNTTDATAPILSKTAIIKGISPDSANTIDTFKNLNGFSSETSSLDAQYKTAAVQGRRTYIGNIKQDGKTHPDRILKSQVNRFDTFPEGMGSVDVVIRDGESIVKLEAFADRVLQFKERSLYIINVSETVDFLEDTYNNKGCSFPYHVIKTDFGIAWFNSFGVYFFDGKQVTNLLEKNGMRLISEADWEAFITDGEDGSADDADMSSAHIGYIPKKRQLLIKNENTDVFIYDFVLRAWMKGVSKITIATNMTNFALDGDQNLFYIDNVNTTRKTWQPSAQASAGFEYITPDIDFGEPGVRKKVYKVRISYKGDADSLNVRYSKNGDTDTLYNFCGTNSDGSTTGSADATPLLDKADLTLWSHAELKPATSSVANNIYSFQIHMDGTVDSDFEINDISIIYRMKSIR